jgi:hypothetical protein
MPENERQGTGKHPHKSTEEPYPHRESNSGREERGRGSNEPQTGSTGGSTSSTEDLKEREYRDNKGEVHHHTHTYEDQHK